MKFPRLQGLVSAMFPTQRGWIEQLVVPINDFMLLVSSALQGGLTFSDNMNASVRNLTVKGGSGFPMYVKVGGMVKGIQVWQCLPLDGTEASGPVFIHWEMASSKEGNQVKIKAIDGLVTDKRYSLTFVCLNG